MIIMNKRTVIAGIIVLAVGVALWLVGLQTLFSMGTHIQSALWRFAYASEIVGGLISLAGIILIIYGAILPDPPVHWNNNL